MSGTVAEIWRYPVKGLAGERLERVAIAAGRTLPNDRRFAVAHGDSGITPAAPRWELKTSCHMLMHAKDERLTELTPRYDESDGTLTIRRNGLPLIAARAGEPAGRAQLDAFFAKFADIDPKYFEVPVQVVRAKLEQERAAR